MMIQPLFGIVGTAVIAVVASAVGALAFYLVLRNNAKIKATVDAAVQDIKNKTKL